MISLHEHFKRTLGTYRALFVDDYHVSEVQNLTKQLHQPTKHEGNPLLVGEGDEGDYVVLHGSVLHDPEDDLYKMWYMGGQGYHYAISKDGVTWKKPDLGVFGDRRQPDNAVFRGAWPRQYVAHEVIIQGVSVILDEHASVADERFKLFTFCTAPVPVQEKLGGQCEYGYYTATSPDGIHWSCCDTPVLSKRQNDPRMSDCNTCMYDPLGNRFIAFTKRHIPRGDSTGDQDIHHRARGVSFSEDFVHWTNPVTCLYADDFDPPDMQLYRQNGWAYEGMYLGLVEPYYSSRHNPTMPMCRDTQLVSSRDGEHWFRAGNRDTFIPIGGPGTWDAFMIDTPSNGPFIKGDELWFYYGGRQKRHNFQEGFFANGDDENRSAIGLATLRRDGFVSYDTGDDEGILRTKPVIFPAGRELRVNADASRGSLQVEIITVTEDPEAQLRDWGIQYGEPLEGFDLSSSLPLTADSVDHAMQWTHGADIAGLGDRLLAFRFRLRNASLYSFWID